MSQPHSHTKALAKQGKNQIPVRQKDKELSLNAICAANAAIYQLVQENDDLTCRTIAENPAGYEILCAFEGVFRGMSADEYHDYSQENTGGNTEPLHMLLENTPKTLATLDEKLSEAAAEIKKNIPRILADTKENAKWITSRKVLSPAEYSDAIDRIKEGVLTVARTARLPETLDVDAVLVPPARAQLGRG